MKVITGNRRSGRTTELIKEADDTGAIIVCANQLLCTHVSHLAADMGYSVRVMTFETLARGGAQGQGSPVLIDNLEFCIRSAFGVELDAVSCLADEVRTIIRDPEFRELVR